MAAPPPKQPPRSRAQRKREYREARDLRHKQRLTKSHDIEDAKPNRAPTFFMMKAHCLYKDCSNTEVLPVARAGASCKDCGRPLSWYGPEDTGEKLTPTQRYMAMLTQMVQMALRSRVDG